MVDPEPGDGLESRIGVEPFDAYTPQADMMYPWIDEVRVSVELPMGPRGPEGPVPTFDVHNVIVASTQGAADVQLHQGPHGGPPPGDGIWYFDFVVPQGPAGAAGSVGPPWNVVPVDLTDPSQLPPTGSVGDVYAIPNAVTGATDLYAWGVDPVTGSGGWTVLPAYQGPPGTPGLAHVDDDVPPDDPEVGELWFRPSRQGYSPTGLRVDNGLQLDVAGGSVWGDNGALVLGIGLPGTRLEQARVTQDSVRVKALDVSGARALSMAGGFVQIGVTGGTVVAAGLLEAATPTVSTPPRAVATKEYVDQRIGSGVTGFVAKTGDTMTGDLTVPATTAATPPAAVPTKGYVDSLVPPGVVHPYAGAQAPQGWLLAQGQSVSRASYPALFAAIGTTYGAADANTFNLPDLRGRTIYGFDSRQGGFNVMGFSGGAATHTMTEAEMPRHGHRVGVTNADDFNAGAWVAQEVGNVWEGWRFTQSSATSGKVNLRRWVATYTGGSQPHNNMPPYQTLQYIIRAV